MFPRLKQRSRLPESDRLRDHLLFMVFVHTLFIFLEIFLYDTRMILMASDLFYIWVLYQGYMTLSSWALWLYVVLMFICPIVGIRTVMAMGLSLSTFVFII